MESQSSDNDSCGDRINYLIDDLQLPPEPSVNFSALPLTEKIPKTTLHAKTKKQYLLWENFCPILCAETKHVPPPSDRRGGINLICEIAPCTCAPID